VPSAAANGVLAGPRQFLLEDLLHRHQPIQEGGRTIWEYELVVSEQELELADGTRYKVWAFGGTIPGPTLIAREGDWVRITLINETSNPHTIHSHGLFVPLRMDGVPHALNGPHGAHGGHGGGHGAGELPRWAHPVAPGEAFTYEYIARPAGTHFYHCHVNPNEHLDRGMSGALIVLPREPEPAVDVDVIWLIDEWNSDFAREGTPGHPRQMADYNFFTINGASFPYTESIHAPLGGLVRLRVINAGALSHALHLHGHTFLVTHKDGAPLAEPLEMDTVPISPAERVDLIIAANNPGLWHFHCHSSPHVTNNGQYPGGMMSHLVVGDELFPETGEGPEAPGLEAVRRAWRSYARRALELGEEEPGSEDRFGHHR
jgi:FtsP/CotA-like multicopper oxidase with cupredoxin domain